MNEHARLHALDNLRAIMMWLGIVLHVAILYTVTPGVFPIHDRQTTIAADLLTVFIHAFRMPVFFILAGFFAALLAARDGHGGMWRNRLRRIGLPFALFWPPLFVAVILAFMLFVHVMARGTLGIDPALMEPPPGTPKRPMLSTTHLWFLYYLLIFCGAAALLGRFAGAGAMRRITLLAGRLGSGWWACIVLALPSALIAFDHPGGIAPNRTSFIPYPDELLHNGLFFAFGWLLHQRRDELLARLARHCWRHLAAGMVVLLAYLVISAWSRSPNVPAPMAARLCSAFAYACCGWLLSFALIGLFTRYLRHSNALLTYLARSSYWVYLLHFPLTVAFGALLYRLDAAAPVKMLLNVAATTALCLLTYHLLVRRTRIGRLLGGAASVGRSHPLAYASPPLPADR